MKGLLSKVSKIGAFAKLQEEMTKNQSQLLTEKEISGDGKMSLKALLALQKNKDTNVVYKKVSSLDMDNEKAPRASSGKSSPKKGKKGK